MAANQIIINSAGQAYTPAKGEGQGNLIGMLQAVAAIGKGIATRDAKITKGLEIVDGMTIDTDMEPLKEMFIEKQQALANSSLPDINKGIKDLKLLQLHAKESLPKIKEFMFKMQKEKFSNGVDPLAANYIDAFLTGRLDGTVTVKDKETGQEKEVSTWMMPNANKDGVVVVGLDGNYVDPAVLLKQLTGMVRVSDSKEAYDLTTNYLKRTDLKWSADGEGTKKWKTISTTYMDEMRNEWENDPNSFVSFALDRKHTINGVRTSFSQEYLNNFLDGAEEEALNALVEDYALNQDPPIAVEAVSDKVKGLLVREIMLSDPNLENDKTDYLEMVTNSMEPLKPENIEEYNYTTLPVTGYKPGIKNPALNINKLTKEDKRDYEVVKDIEEMIAGITAGKSETEVSTTIGAGLKLQLVKKEGTENTYYFRENLFGAKDNTGAEIEKRFSPTFDITNKKQVRNIMPTILAQYGVRPGDTIFEDYFKYYNVK